MVSTPKVWTDTVGWIPTVTRLGYLNLFAQIRAVNQGLPPSERIHVWLGDPPIDWSQIKTRADVTQLSQRDRYPAELIKSQILAKGKKGLVIYGTFHFLEKRTIKPLVEQSYPNSFFVVTPYIGFIERSCSETFERENHEWPNRALVSPVRDTDLQSRLRSPGCHFFSASDFQFSPSVSEADRKKALADMDDGSSGIAGDSLLYLGPASTLTESPYDTGYLSR